MMHIYKMKFKNIEVNYPLCNKEKENKNRLPLYKVESKQEWDHHTFFH